MVTCWGVTPPKKGLGEYETKLHLILRLQFWRYLSGEYPLLLLLQVHSRLEQKNLFVSHLWVELIYVKLFVIDRTLFKKIS